MIEKTALGIALAQDLRKSADLTTILSSPRVDKGSRLEAQAGKFQAGNVHLPSKADWLGSYLGEILGFPNAKHDDQVDSTSQALRYLTSAQRPAVDVRDDRFGPSGRRTRASLTRPSPIPDDPTPPDEFEILVPLQPRIIRVPAEYEPPPEDRWHPRS